VAVTVAVKVAVGVRVAVTVEVTVGVAVGDQVWVFVRVAVTVGIGVGVRTVTGLEGQVGTAVASQFLAAVPQEVVAKVQLEIRFGQEVVCMDQAVDPAIPLTVGSQANIFPSKVALSVLQEVEGPISPTKTG
jgi:hypothetical protein